MWGFLANLGSGLARLGSGFAHGAMSVGRGIGRGLGRLGEMADGPELPGPGGTPPFVPDAGRGRGVRMIEDAVAGAENAARADLPTPLPALPARPDLPDLPIDRRKIEIPPLAPGPTLESLRSSNLPSVPLRSRLPIAVTPAGPPPVGAMPKLEFEPEPIRDYRGREIGDPIAFNRDQYMRQRMGEGGGFRRNLGMTLRNALMGASRAVQTSAPGEDPLGRAIGGALTAGAGSAIDPRSGYEFAFEAGERPKLEAEIARSREEQDRARAERMAAMDEALKQGQIARIPLEEEAERARIEAARANIEIAREDQKRKQRIAEAQENYYNARAEAVRTGNPKFTDRVNPVTGEIETVLVFPNGSEQVVGGSAAAAISAERNRSAERRVAAQQAGANARTATTQAGANQRQAERLAAQDQGGAGQSKLRKPNSQGGKTATMSQLREFYSRKGITDDAEIRRRARNFGITVKD